jgi:hypothetical protein
MPKVTEEYLESKRRMIVDACYQVCLRKPVEMVTISDVIAETGMSQGAIYRYYNGLDEILADMSSKIRADYNIIEQFEKILTNKDATFEEITYQVCDCLGETMEKHLSDIQKINFDFGVLAINEPERAAKIMADIKSPGNLDYLGKKAIPMLIEGACKSGYHPAASPEDIGIFISSSYAGIEKYCILTHCYGTGDLKIKVEPRKLFRTLADSIILFLGGKTNVQ